MRGVICVVIALAVVSSGCAPDQIAEKGETGERGPAGPRGPGGPPGSPGPPARWATLRFAEFTCDAPACSASCETNERLLRAYAINPAGTFMIDTVRSVIYRPPPNKISGKMV